MQCKLNASLQLYLCLGFSPYNAWLNLSFSLFSAMLHKSPNGRISMVIRNALLNIISPGIPLFPTRFRTQEPLLVLRKTWRSRHAGRINLYTNVQWCKMLPTNHHALLLFFSCRIGAHTCLVTLLSSTAISPPELPIPNTTTFLFLHSSAVL